MKDNPYTRTIAGELAEDRQATPAEDAILTEGRSIIGMEEPPVAGPDITDQEFSEASQLFGTTAEERAAWANVPPKTWLDGEARVRLLCDFARLEAERDSLRAALIAAGITPPC